MHTVEEIENAIERLPSGDFRRLIAWLREREQQRWDARMDADSVAGKLDFLFEEADDERAAGLLRDWPPSP